MVATLPLRLPALLAQAAVIRSVDVMALPRRTDRTARWCFAALVAVDAVGAIVATRHRIAGEPFGVGRSLDPRRPHVSVLWGTGLSAPLASLAAVAAAAVWRPALLRPAGAVFALGALSEPVVWGRRPCSWPAGVGVMGHVALAAAMSLPRSERTDRP